MECEVARMYVQPFRMFCIKATCVELSHFGMVILSEQKCIHVIFRQKFILNQYYDTSKYQEETLSTTMGLSVESEIY